MKYLNYDILIKEIPWKMSLCFAMTGCNIKCSGCHSKELWDSNNWKELTLEVIEELALKYKGLFDVILFFGGEWNGQQFITLLEQLKTKGYSLALYTWLNSIGQNIKQYLDYLKTGPYVQELGGLESETTNQRLFSLISWEELTKRLQTAKTLVNSV